MIAKNKEDYITFSVKVTVDRYTDKDDDERDKFIELQFINSFKFMAFSLDLLTNNLVNPISTGLFCLVVSLGGGGVFHPPSITPLSLKSDCSNFVQSYFQIG